jgi:DNA-binding GntR family transcriptional regulator
VARAGKPAGSTPAAGEAGAQAVAVMPRAPHGSRDLDSEAGIERPAQLKDVVYERLRTEIIESKLRPGDPLREAELSKRLGVSKTPIREALVRLQRDRLVELVPYKGAVVSGYTRSDLAHIYQLRELLEGACARDAARSATPDDLSLLATIVRETNAALAAGDEVRMAELFYAFDEVVYRQTQNPYIVDLIANLGVHLYRIGQLTLAIPGRFKTSAEQHEQIYEAILRRDAVEAEARMREHVTSVMVDQLAEFPPEGLGRASSKSEQTPQEDEQ